MVTHDRPLKWPSRTQSSQTYVFIIIILCDVFCVLSQKAERGHITAEAESGADFQAFREESNVLLCFSAVDQQV